MATTREPFAALDDDQSNIDDAVSELPPQYGRRIAEVLVAERVASNRLTDKQIDNIAHCAALARYVRERALTPDIIE